MAVTLMVLFGMDCESASAGKAASLITKSGFHSSSVNKKHKRRASGERQHRGGIGHLLV